MTEITKTLCTCFRESEMTVSLDLLGILNIHCKPHDIKDHLSSKPGNYLGLNVSTVNRPSPPSSISNNLLVFGKVEQDFQSRAQKTYVL